ncbi:hypothetical protein [Streptosporangium sp. NPDC020145]|uniref:hypothetical protein n=1 Tax=Streptosporangium sp. NPDC020145 TaxID=3154694 RepID=UPI0034252F99
MAEVSAGTLTEMLNERRHLIEIALWMLGSEPLADRIVQETYRRWYSLDEAERGAITVPRAWLTKVAGGICLELLAAPAPAPAPGVAAPEHRPEPVGPARPPALTAEPTRPRALAVGSAHPRALAEHDRVVRRFARVWGLGDVTALREILAGNATAVSDGGGKLRAAVHPVHGADAVACFVVALLTGQSGTEVTAESVNGRTGLVLRQAGQAVAVVGMSVAGALVTAVWIVLNPDKLRPWHRPLPRKAYR